nr:uncharacterized protein LOC123751414 [Procambarus clarkii]
MSWYSQHSTRSFLTLVMGVWVSTCLTQPQDHRQRSPGPVHGTRAMNVDPTTSTTVPASGAATRWGQTANLTCGNIQEAVLDARVLLDLIDAMKNNYTLYEFGTTWDTMDELLIEARDNTSLQICDENGEYCMFVLPNLPPPPHTPPATEQGLKLALVSVLGYVQRYAVAFETLLLDQTLHEDIFASQIAEVHAFLEDLIDTLIATVLLCGLQPEQHLVRDLSVRMYKGGDTVLRSDRGFRVLRQARNGLQFIIDVFGNNPPVP